MARTNDRREYYCDGVNVHFALCSSSDDKSYLMTFKKTFYCIAAISFLLRLAALTYGIPQSFGADEIVSVLGALKILEGGHLWGSSLLYIPPLFSYMMAPLIGAFGLFGMLIGTFHGVAGFREFAIFHYEY